MGRPPKQPGISIGMPDNYEIISTNNLVMRIQKPVGKGPYPVLLMLHGWTGDENSMWIFSPRLLKNAILIAPRGIYKTKSSGYSWHADITLHWPRADDFLTSVEKLMKAIFTIRIPEANISELHVIGFSQGAALGYMMAIMNPLRVTTLVGLSGFLPDGVSILLKPDHLKGLPVFIAHGTEDDIVPIELARMSVSILQDAGAAVVYCEDQVGHKLSTKCFRGLEAFYQKVNC
jgi:phospholipase/carboxylesterase